MSQVVKEQSAYLPGTNIKAVSELLSPCGGGGPPCPTGNVAVEETKEGRRAEWSGMYRFPFSVVSPPPRHQRDGERESRSDSESWSSGEI